LVEEFLAKIISGVTKVGVIRCGNWWCHPIFSLKTADYTILVNIIFPVFSVNSAAKK